MVDFGGWEMPQQYSSIRDEHFAVRQAAGLFDVSHMGRFSIQGRSAAAFLQKLVTNDIATLAPRRAMYALLCREDGGIIDDLVVYRDTDDRFIVVVNASNREKDLAWMRQFQLGDVELDDITLATSLIAYQGPRAQELLPPGTSSTENLPYFGWDHGRVADVDALISRTGYTGEDGFELFVAQDEVGNVWDAILEQGRSAGALPAGLGARDATRLEAALRLWGNDMDETVNPYEAGLGWTVKLGKGDFIGRDQLRMFKESGPRRRLVGLKLEPGSIARHGAPVLSEDKRVGVITSGTHSFFLGYPIALALVEDAALRIGDTVTVEVRDRPAAAEIVQLPFYRSPARSAVSQARF
jgi:aminomethyltransferase